MGRSYSIEARGKKFATVCRTDGFWSITWLSKNKKAARRKGEDFVSGKRTAMRKYVTVLGAAINEQKSRQPKCAPMISGTGPMKEAQFAALMAGVIRVMDLEGHNG